MLFIVAIVRQNGILRSKYLVDAANDAEAQHKLVKLANEEKQVGEPIYFPGVDDTIQVEPVELENGILQL